MPPTCGSPTARRRSRQLAPPRPIELETGHEARDWHFLRQDSDEWRLEVDAPSSGAGADAV